MEISAHGIRCTHDDSKFFWCTLCKQSLQPTRFTKRSFISKALSQLLCVCHVHSSPPARLTIILTVILLQNGWYSLEGSELVAQWLECRLRICVVRNVTVSISTIYLALNEFALLISHLLGLQTGCWPMETGTIRKQGWSPIKNYKDPKHALLFTTTAVMKQNNNISFFKCFKNRT